MKGLLIGLLLASATFAADVSGVWNGTFTAQRGDGTWNEPKPAFLELKQSGEKLTGKVGEDEEHAFEVTEGSMKDGVVTLNAAMPDGSVKLTLKLKDGQLDGEVILERNGEKRRAMVKFKK